MDKCTCVSTGPRGGKSCQFCLDFHAKYFPAFPGEPGWHLNAGAVDRNQWGIVPTAIETRDHERASILQLDRAFVAYRDARAEYVALQDQYNREHTLGTGVDNADL